MKIIRNIFFSKKLNSLTLFKKIGFYADILCGTGNIQRKGINNNNNNVKSFFPLKKKNESRKKKPCFDSNKLNIK